MPTTPWPDGAITTVSVRACRLPPATPWEDATHIVGALEFVFVELTTADGRSGNGFGYTVGVGATAVAALIEDYLAATIRGQSVTEPHAITSLMRAHLDRTGTGAISRNALAAVETALWDLVAKSRGISVAAALGGVRDGIGAYASSIDLLLSPDELAEDVQGRLDRGYRGVKIKVGRPTVQEDIDRVAVVRDVVREDVTLYLDANQGWDVDEAVARLRSLERFAPDWIEEPLDPDDIAGHARIRQQTSVPVAVGESLYSTSQFLAYVAADAVDILQPDVARVGGFAEWLRIARLAHEHGKSVSAHYIAELSVHAMCAVPNALLLEDVRGGSLYELGLSTRPLVRDGFASLDAMVGSGLALDQAAVERHHIDKIELRAQSTLSAKVLQGGVS